MAKENYTVYSMAMHLTVGCAGVAFAILERLIFVTRLPAQGFVLNQKLPSSSNTHTCTTEHALLLLGGRFGGG